MLLITLTVNLVAASEAAIETAVTSGQVIYTLSLKWNNFALLVEPKYAATTDDNRMDWYTETVHRRIVNLMRRKYVLIEGMPEMKKFTVLSYGDDKVAIDFPELAGASEDMLTTVAKDLLKLTSIIAIDSITVDGSEIDITGVNGVDDDGAKISPKPRYAQRNAERKEILLA